ncbi:olfactory receptor 5AN1-like [Clupea harengus]|uniref:Olfactory receptor n=1 Tax=Clupea harengus TaxID=7950 RepID=A0A6P3WB63_CLUHA|nr:olfactory receptor 5AN1-like [Clupea harengus]
MNESFHVTLIFAAYKDMGSAKYVLFTVVFLIYLASLLVSISILLLIYLDISLHKPMFIFLFSLIANGLIGSTAVWPKVMVLLLTDVNTGSYKGCLIQIFLIGSYGVCNNAMLTVMAYDRFVSIFKPLQYHTIMTPQKVKQLSFVAYFVPATFLLGQVCLTTQISLCQYTIHKIFCDKLSIFSLSCGDSIISHVSNVYGIFLLIGFGVLPVFLVFLSYWKIVLVTMNASTNARKKAFETCTPHLIIFINFSVATFFSIIYNRISDYVPGGLNVFVSINYVLIPPLMHPVIYGWKNKEIQRSLSKIWRKAIFAVSESLPRVDKSSKVITYCR